MATLERAIALAAAAHAGQFDKAGAPYILHPLRVMLRVGTPEARIAAVLHDVVEDTPWTLEQLAAEGFSPAVLEAVALLTHEASMPKGEDAYLAYVRRAATNPIARVVKRADLEDNLDRSRIANFTERDEARMARYRRALAELDATAERAI